MRQDMWRLIVDEPRGGQDLPSQATRLRLSAKDINQLDPEDLDDHDYGPNRWPMSVRNKYMGPYQSKSQGDRLSPLERFLQSRVGRLWNAVHSEIAATLDNRSLMRGRHVWTHVFQMVTLNCVIGDDGRIYDALPRRFLVYGLYVHPENGLLLQQEWLHPSGNRHAEQFRWRLEEEFGISGFGSRGDYQKTRDWRNFRIADELTVLELNHSGCWFVHRYEHYQPDDVVRYRYNSVTGGSYPVYYGDGNGYPAKRCVKRQQCGKKELKKYREVIARYPAYAG